jgi:hypothetical protein
MQVRAKVTLQVEIDVHSSWGPDTALSQVHKQASEEAINTLRHAILDTNNNLKGCHIRIMGEPQVNAVIASKS